MKTYFLTLFLLVTISTKSQSWGVHLNGYYTIPTGEIVPETDLKGKEAGSAGFFKVFKLNSFDIHVELNVSHQKIEWKGKSLTNSQGYKTVDLAINYLEIPIMIKKRFYDEKIGLMGGLQNGILTNNPSFKEEDIREVITKGNTYRLSFLIGVDYDIFNSDLFVQLRYIGGITKIFNTGDFKNSVISLGIAYIIE